VILYFVTFLGKSEYGSVPTLTDDCPYTVQKGERVRLVLLMQHENILYMTDTVGVASFSADFCMFCRFAWLKYMEYAGMLRTLLIAYSSKANLDNF
jgi:hypothetical protein